MPFTNSGVSLHLAGESRVMCESCAVRLILIVNHRDVLHERFLFIASAFRAAGCTIVTFQLVLCVRRCVRYSLTSVQVRLGVRVKV